MLTKRQYELLTFIHERLKETGVSPSFDEMRVAMNLRSKSGIHRLITALSERGFVEKMPQRARSVRILELPETLSPSMMGANASSNLPPLAANNNEAITLPVMGRIAAGTPIEALQEQVSSISVPTEMMRSGEHYALEVHGDSMIEAGIFDGDTAIIQRSQTADNGDIVVALVEGHEATLKRMRQKGEMIALEAANPAFETRIFRSDQINVQGRLVGLVRKY